MVETYKHSKLYLVIPPWIWSSVTWQLLKQTLKETTKRLLRSKIGGFNNHTVRVREVGGSNPLTPTQFCTALPEGGASFICPKRVFLENTV
jgi:hypothetical protein